MKPQIKTFEDACKATGRNPEMLPDVSMLPEADRQYIIDKYKLIVIAEALNNGWKADFTDHNQVKYWPWFYQEEGSGSASGFSYGYVFAYSSTYVGARLCFKSRELAEYAGKQFIDLYRSVMI